MRHPADVAPAARDSGTSTTYAGDAMRQSPHQYGGGEAKERVFFAPHFFKTLPQPSAPPRTPTPPTHYSIKLGLELYHHFPIIIDGLMHKSQFRLYKAVNL